MKFRHLGLERYGHFADHNIALPATARLHLIVGDNEAGKTTALAAIGDFLFGFGHRSEYGFRHGLDSLRVAGELETATGTRLRYVRHKRRKDPLLDGDGAAVPPTALAPLLGGLDRERFEAMFGLNAARLRAGGQAILEQGGGLGLNLFEAATGLSGTAELIAGLEREAAALFTPRRGKDVAFHKAQAALTDANREIARLATSFQAWQEQRDAVAAATAAEAQDRATYSALAVELARLQRIRNTVPLQQRLAKAEMELAEFADAPLLDADADQRRQNAERAQASAAQDLLAARTRLAEIAAELETLPPAGRLALRREAIEDLRTRLGAVRKALSDLPRVSDEAAAAEATIAEALAALGRNLTPAQAEAAQPPPAALARLQRLVQEAPALRQREADATQRGDVAGRAHAESRAAVEMLPAAQDVALLRQVATDLRRQGDLAASLADRGRAEVRARQRLADALTALPAWSGDAAALEAAPIPAEATIRRFRSQLAEAEAAVLHADDAVVRAVAAIDEIERTISALQGGESLPTRDAIVDLRGRRDAAWRHLRDAHLAAGLPAPAALPEAFEALLQAADAASDRRQDAGERVVKLEAAQAEAAARREAHAGAATQAAAKHAALDAAGQTWRQAWQPAGMLPLSPEEMLDWTAKRTQALDLRTGALDAQAATEAARQAHDAARVRLGGALEASADEPLALLLDRAEIAIAAADAAARLRERAEDKLRGAAADHVQKAAEAAAAEKAKAKWEADWEARLAAIGLGADTPPDAAGEAVEHWRTVREQANTWRDRRSRIEGIARDESTFRRDAADCAAAVAADLAGGDAFVVVPALHERLTAEQAADAQRAKLAEQQEQAKARERAAQADLLRAGNALAALRAAAGVPPDGDLAAALARSAERVRREQAAAEARAATAANPDGLAFDVLLAEAEDADLDAIAARIAAIEAERTTLMERQSRHGAARHEAEAALARMDQESGAAGEAQLRREALAAMNRAALDYARLHAARCLLSRGVERFRQRQQAPLMARAGVLFAGLTGGRYAGLAVGYDDDRPIVLARRIDGTELRTEALSEGTADQLYLALRLAHVEEHAAAAEPLPFIGDDLLVQFDDNRAAAALRLLAAPGGRTQTILFTHHRHLADLARDHVDPGRLAIHELVGP